MKQLVVGALAAAAIVAASAAPAQATSFPQDQPVPVDPGIGGSASGLLFLEVERRGLTNGALLACPSGAGHSKGVDACAQLTMAEGDFDALEPAADALCTKEHDPVVLRAVGVWDGDFVVFEREYSNYCVGVNATGGSVFELGKP
ncbi:SSI family serine proteinase inhibitor [Glycomyces niveus]|uniref:Subtilisin inhibitor domain-containing protein n=1 Tax=Glycomyces niveus TaxID=2820287 RepID=A0ABS3TYL0_9ACTN|nr:SSI family serine proteinase inhibitor [Glycomyces sp. NEAU-S30]MBO3731586.1 hypothetical protein [Glycomyces sp. NEAU-S30]